MGAASHRLHVQGVGEGVQHGAAGGDGQRHVAGRCGGPGRARNGRGGRNGRHAARRRADLPHVAAAEGQGDGRCAGHHEVCHLQPMIRPGDGTTLLTGSFSWSIMVSGHVSHFNRKSFHDVSDSQHMVVAPDLGTQ